MNKKTSKEDYCIMEVDKKEYLISYECGAKWRFHSFIADSWPTEEQAATVLRDGLKTGAIPQGRYRVV